MTTEILSIQFVIYSFYFIYFLKLFHPKQGDKATKTQEINETERN